jgi:3-hydroxyisobutyrate dehydrogenase-like beta-hydroxyacid dehydrogenase
LILALPKPPDVLKAFEGEDGFLAGLSKGKIWIDHSTTDYEQNENMNEKVFEYLKNNTFFNRFHD